MFLPSHESMAAHVPDILLNIPHSMQKSRMYLPHTGSFSSLSGWAHPFG